MLITCVVLLGLLPTQIGRATDVDTDVSVRETLVGLPVVLTIRITNSVEHDPPEFPRVSGLEIEQVGVPQRSRRVSILNGRRTETNDIIYTFRVTPHREGRFTIPPIRVTADGARRLTKAVRIIATKGETDDLIFVEIAGNEREIYVGEPLELQLKIWIRPFRDPKLQRRLSEGEMWNQLLVNRSSWGNFQQAMDEMESNGQRPAGNPRLRKDSEGNEFEYYLYVIESKVYPDRPGQLEGSDVRIVMQYPQELARARSPLSMLDDDDFFGGNSPFRNSPFGDAFDDAMFGGGLKISKWKPLVAEAEVQPITLKPVPTAGRPDDYRGAVGQFSILTEATPREVAVGDPITLHIGIDGKGQLDVVRAPPIESQQDLISNFKVPDEPLAGFVNRQQKVFSTTIRPTKEGVTEIPGIRFSYFDPELEQFVTTTSNPISITVNKAEVLSLDSIVGSAAEKRRANSSDPSANASNEQSKEAEVDTLLGSGRFGNGDELLTPVQRASFPSTSMIVAIGVGPLAALIVLLTRSRTSIGRLVPARSRFRRELGVAQTPLEVAGSLERFLTAHYRLPDSRLRRDQAIGAMRASGETEIAIRAERFYSSCSQTPGRDDAAWLNSLREQAEALADDVVSSKIHRSPSSLMAGRIAVAMLCSMPLGSNSASASELELTIEQQRTILQEALPIDSSLSGVALEQTLTASQEKLQTLIDAGIENDKLFFALGRIAHRSGDLGAAIANYRRALRLKPENESYRQQLFRAEADADLVGVASNNVLITISNSSWFRFIPIRWLRMTFLIGWFGLWIVVLARLLGNVFPWKTLVALCFVIASLSGGGYLIGIQEFVRDGNAVLVAEDVTVRSGDGDEFDSLMELANASGSLVRCVADRENWLQIELPNGTRGWIRRDMAITI
ncbi:MAG: BatD family protein [Planctomycetota bacterium]